MPRIGYILHANPEMQSPSTRINMNMFPFLRQAGYDPFILYYPRFSDETPNFNGVVEQAISAQADIVFFQKIYSDSAARSARALRDRGVKTVFSVCDVVAENMASSCDLTIAVSEHLAQRYPAYLRDKIHLIHDGIECPDIHKEQYSTCFAHSENPMNAVLLTSQHLNEVPLLPELPDYVRLTVIGNYGGRGVKKRVLTLASRLQQDPKRIFRYIWKAAGLPIDYFLNMKRHNGHNGIDFNKIDWDLETVFANLIKFDIGIIPVDLQSSAREKTKSQNRLTQMMAAGLPVIASPVPSYLPIIENGVNGYIARTMYEWIAAFEELKDPETREKIGKTARESVIDKFSQQRQAEKLIVILNSH